MTIDWQSFLIGAGAATLFWMAMIVALWLWINWALAKAFNP